MNWTLLGLIILIIGHYISQKKLLAEGWKAESAEPQIKRLMINGALLIVLSIFLLLRTQLQLGIPGILLFIEGAVCLAFARKLKRK